MINFLKVLWGIIYETAPYVLLGMLASGFLSEALVRFHRIRSFVSRKSFLGLTFFNLFGFAMPICSCGTIPMAVGFRNRGVPFGSIYSFIFTAPATSIAAVIFSLALLGRTFTLFYICGALLCGYAIGAIFYSLDYLSWYHPSVIAPESIRYRAQSIDARDGYIKRCLKRGFVVYGSEIAVDMIVGLITTSLLVSSYSLQTLTGWFEHLPFYQAAPLMMALALPMYVCSLPGILMGATLVFAGLHPALLWVFLMSGPITNLGDMNVLRRHVGAATTAIYIVAVVVVTYLWGLVIEHHIDAMDMWLYVREYFSQYPNIQAGTLTFSTDASSATGDTLTAVIHYGSSALFMILIGYGAASKFKQVWLNPCLHCIHYQHSVGIDIRSCRRPCWKKQVQVHLRKAKAATVQQ